MWGAIIGDIVGSVYEFHNVKSKDFSLWTTQSHYTDDTVCTIAIADAMLRQVPFDGSLRHWVRKYPDVGYGAGFRKWAMSEEEGPYKSYGNGAVMRLSPVGFLAKDHIQAVMAGFEATGVTHNSAEALTATEAYIDAMYHLKNGIEPKVIRDALSQRYGYNMNRSVDEIRMTYDKFYVRCSKSVPEAIICALEGKDFEDTIRNAVSLGGDSDTIAAMAGALAELRFGVPKDLKAKAYAQIPNEMRDVLARMYFSPRSVVRQRFSYHPVSGAKERS